MGLGVIHDFLYDFIVSLSIIALIGAQNLFVLKADLQRTNILAICSICILCDAVLIGLGIFNFQALNKILWLQTSLITSGTIFVFVYGCLCFRSTWNAKAITGTSQKGCATTDNKKSTMITAIIKTLSVALLNPHVYLDTILIIGSLAVNLTKDRRIAFCRSGSFLWFMSIGYGARLFAGRLNSSKASSIMNYAIGCMMWVIAINLVRELI